MSTSVNLVPLACLHARARSKRRNTWAVLTLGTGVFVLSVWLVSGTASNAVKRASRRLGGTQARQLALNRELTSTTATRAGLIDQLRLLSDLQQAQPWAQRLAMLAAQTPPGIVLTQVTADAEGLGSPAAAAGTPAGRSQRIPSPSRAARPVHPDTTAPVGGPVGRQQTPPLIIQVSGVAVDHDELTRLIEALQGSEGWGRVDLTRAARRPFLNGFAVAFQLQCENREARP